MAAAHSIAPDQPQSLDRCPRRDHSLVGLPAFGECPDCGLSYDESPKTWPARHLRAYRAPIAFLVLAAGAFVAMGVARGDSLSWWMAGLFGLGLLSHVGWHFATRRWRLSVGPVGILIRNARAQLLTWDQLRPVDQWRCTDQISVHSRDTLRSVWIYEFLPDRATINEFRACVSEHQLRRLGA